MAREHGPYSVAFPVDFTSKGDTTRDAFRKHMDEITRIYGILTGLDADTIDSDAVNEILQKHVNSTNPHPNYTPSVSWANVTNKPGLGDLSGNIDGSRISGMIAASKVSGALTGATIATGNVTGLEAFVNGKIPDGITESTLGETGYVKFGNGLIMQWGSIDYNGNGTLGMVINFPIAFTKECYSLTVTPQTLLNAVIAFLTPLVWGSSDLGLSKSGFRVHLTNLSGGDATEAKLSYIAIGA